MKAKRASKKVEHLNMEIRRGIYGFYPHSLILRDQTSKVFKTAQEAVDAVLEGFRPTQGLPKKAGQIVELPGKNSSI
jgi:hypothetical protein